MSFAAARAAFATFQASHAPPRLDPADAGSFAWRFVHGTTAFVALDARSNRNYPKNVVLGRRQLDRFGR